MNDIKVNTYNVPLTALLVEKIQLQKSDPLYVYDNASSSLPGRVAQSVMCLVTDVKLTADPGVASSIPAQSHNFLEIDHEIISTVILLPSAESFMKVCYQLQAKVCARLLVNCLFKLAQEKSVVR